MKSISKILKLLIPLAFGGFIIWAFYDAMCQDQREEMFNAFSEANYFWIAFSLIFGFASHVSRAWRWKYLLEPLGAKTKFWDSYHAVMSGYLINYIFPRAGEPARAAIMSRRTKLPFDKVFGTIIAERAVDLVMLGIVAVLALISQMDNLELFQEQIKSFSGSSECGSSPVLSFLGQLVKWIIIVGVLGSIAMFVFIVKFRTKLMEMVKGVWEGVTTIFRSKRKGAFIGHSIFIWVMYILFFGICFPSLEATSSIGVDGILAGFIAGTLGIVLVQGGIGVYPAFVGLILTSYINSEYGAGIHPQAIALGWLIWTSQTLMMIVLGLISLISVGGLKNNESPEEHRE